MCTLSVTEFFYVENFYDEAQLSVKLIMRLQIKV